ncbi:MAG: TrbC/VirB2 family protein [Sphingomonas sp.]|jgi:type IV secretion system protein VirB2|uniref:TrbC/VirB2 family protein n=1 Tax=Sphingomonas sp. TaxID=28214 RepID=UPI003566C7B5
MPVLVWAPSACAQDGLGDPTGSGTLVSAVNWLQGALLGTVATTIATIAIAAVGLLMLTGRIDRRRGVATILGSFILFGATTIVAGLRSAVGGGDESNLPIDTAIGPPPIPTVSSGATPASEVKRDPVL